MTAESQVERLSYTHYMAKNIGRGDSLIKRRGPDGAVNRAHFISQVQDYIKSIAPDRLPLLASALNDDHLTFAVPRLYAALLEKGRHGYQNAQQSLFDAYETWQTIPDADQFDFSALLAEQVTNRGINKRYVLSVLLDRDRPRETRQKDIRDEYTLQLWCLANLTPNLWKEYRNLSSEEKLRHRITDIHIPAMIAVYWEGKFQQYVLPTEDDRVMMSMDKSAVEAMLLYKYPEKEVNHYDNNVVLIDRLNVQVHKYIASLGGNSS